MRVDGAFVHPTAVVDAGAVLGRDVEVGAYAVIDAGAIVRDGTRIGSHVRIHGCCDIGEDCAVHSGAALGDTPQIRGHLEDGGAVTIGRRCIIREHATIHRASARDAVTRLGQDVYLMAGAHVAHDCQVADGVTIANGTLLAGYVTVGPSAFLSGHVVVHQFCRIGELSMTGGGAVISQDVPPFMLVADRSLVYGVNVVGLRRAGLPAERRRAIREAFAILYRSGFNTRHAIEKLEAMAQTPEIATLVAFLSTSARGICSPAGRRGRRA